LGTAKERRKSPSLHFDSRNKAKFSTPIKRTKKGKKKLKKRKREREIENFANTYLHGSMAGRKIRVVMKEQEA
jgi:hypothetical protein